jgi:hypothetical protein
MTTDPPVPPEAVTAALDAARGYVAGISEVDVRLMLEAAMPAIREDERDRLQACPTLCDPDCEQLCHEVHDIPRRRDHDPETCRATEIGAAVRAERDRIAAGVTAMRDHARNLASVGGLAGVGFGAQDEALTAVLGLIGEQP